MQFISLYDIIEITGKEKNGKLSKLYFLISLFILTIFLALKINKDATTIVVINFFFVFFSMDELDKNNDVGKNTKDANKL